jgi:hypothetical protein
VNGSAFQARCQMNYLIPSIDELAQPRGFTQLDCDLSIMLGTGHGRFHYSHQCQAAHTNKVVSTAVQKMIASAAFAKSPRVGLWASWLAMNSRLLSIRA